MSPVDMLRLLTQLEWSGSTEVYLEDFDRDPGARVASCPKCRGLKECPDTVTVGDKFSGYTDLPVHPDTKDDVGHRPDCTLKATLESLRTGSFGPSENDDLTRAFCALTEMWGRRYDTDEDQIPNAHEGEPFGSPVAVDLGLLAQAQTSLLSLVHKRLPDLCRELHEGGVPDAPLPQPNPGQVYSLDQHRIRAESEFEDEQVAYMEALWGKETFAFNLAVRDLEQMRRGTEDGTLRPPETYYEMLHMILHIRALANDISRLAGLDHLVRPEDDLHGKGEADGEEPQPGT